LVENRCRLKSAIFKEYIAISQIFTYPSVFGTTLLKRPHRNFTKIFGIRKLESSGYRTALFFFCDPTFSYVGTTLACDGQMDRHITTLRTAYTVLA